MLNKIKAINVFMVLFLIALINLVWNVFIKAFLGMRPGSFLAVYTDMIYFFCLFLFLGAICIKGKRIVDTKLDVIFLLFMAFGFFEILWTYYLTNSFYVGIYRYRLYFFVYLLYFPIKYFFKQRKDYLQKSMAFLKIIILVAFVWGIAEFLLISLGFVSILTIQSLLAVSMTGANVAAYGDISRGFGVLGQILLSGVFYVVGLALFFPSAIAENKLSSKWVVFLGILAVILSLAKTAWLLLLIMFVILGVLPGDKKTKAVFIIISFILLSFLWWYYQSNSIFNESVNGTLYKALPIHMFYINSAFDRADILNWLFGFGYEITEAIEGITNIDLSLTVGNEVFFLALFKQFGIIGIFLYSWLFVIIPFRILFSNDNLFVKGAALAVVISGLSSIHYNAIFHNGQNILTCFLLAYISIESDVLNVRKKKLIKEQKMGET